MSEGGEQLALSCAKAADEIKAENVRIFDLRGISTLTDFMIVCSGNSMPHLKAISRDIEGKVNALSGESPLRTEGKAATRWVVLDFVDVMVHVLHEELRELYALEDLWGDAKELIWKDEDEDRDS
ncbi:MAG: ribosome silencing factor [Verrucomicrobiaceae bacterium]